MTAARQLISLLQSHLDGDEDQFLAVAMQIAAHEARQGHGKLATELRELVEKARDRSRLPTKRPTSGPIPLAQPKGELSSLVSVRYSDTRLSSMVLPDVIETRLKRIIAEQRQQHRLRDAGLLPRRRLLLVGPPGSGKTLTATALAGELQLPLFTVVLEALMSKFMGETASKLKLIFDAMAVTKGVYLFDEFDAIGARRGEHNDVGEIRRILNSFLQFVDTDTSDSLIIAATNHPELLDPALFRRFDDVIEYGLPDHTLGERILRNRLRTFKKRDVDFAAAAKLGAGLSQADLVRAADDAAKHALLANRKQIKHDDLIVALTERSSGPRR